MPTVSVIMPFHRVTPFLRPAVRSILNQTLPDLELVLVDNGTGAGLAALGEEGKDPRIRLISLPTNAGVTIARNLAVTESRGEFIALLDHDDIALPTRLEKQVAVLRAEPGLGLVSSLADQIDSEGRVTGREFALWAEAEQRIFSHYTMPAPTPSYMGRREVFEKFPSRVEFELAEDYDFLTRVLDFWPVRGIPEVLIQYRCHPGQATKERYGKQCLGACVIRVLAARRRQGRDEEYAATIARYKSWLVVPPPLEEIYADFARLCLRERLPLLAVYHARKTLSAARTVRTFVSAGLVVVRALRQAPAEAPMLLRMFFTGPVRAHGVHPA